MENKKIHYGWFILLGVILIRGFSGGGLGMTSGLFLAPVAEDIGVGIGNLSIYLSISSIVMVFWLPIAGKIMNHYDIRLVAMGAGLLQCLAFTGFGFMTSVWGWYLLAIPYAMGTVISVSLLGPVLINRWFHKNVGTIMGIQLAVVGLFGAVIQPLTSRIIRTEGWQQGYIRLGLVALGVVIVTALILLRSEPKDKQTTPYGFQEHSGDAQDVELEISGLPQEKAIKTTPFYMLLFFMIALTGVGVFTSHIATYGRVLGYSMESIGSVLSFSSIGSALGSILIGLLCDRLGSLKTAIGVVMIGVLSVVGFFMGGTSFLVFALSAFLHGLCSSGIMVLSPILTISFFGKKDYEQIFAKVSMGAPLASILLVPIYGFVYDYTGNYQYVLFSLLALLVLSILALVLGWRKKEAF